MKRQPSLMGFLVALQWVVGATTSLQSQTLLSNSRWKITLNVGREPGTWMPNEWAKSGARLLLAMEVCFRNDPFKKELEERLLGPGISKCLEVTSEPSFVSSTGEQSVSVSNNGAWTITQSPRSDEFNYRQAFRFFLDFPQGAIRNDVSIPPGRVFFTTSCWLENELQIASHNMASTRNELDCLQQEIANHQKLENDGPIQKAIGIRSLVLKTEKKATVKERLKTQQQFLPMDAVSGPRGIVLEKERTLSVKRQGGLLGLREEYHILGKFTMRSLD